MLKSTFALLLFASLSTPLFAQTPPTTPTQMPSRATIPAISRSASKQKLDEAYTAKIKEFTTGPEFTTELVDHLPASDRVPSPLKVLGHISGEAGKLTYTADVNRYMRELAKTSKRVKVFSMGKSEEGREMILVAVSDEGNLKNLDKQKQITARLADARKTTDAEAETMIKDGKPFYWFTGAMHSTETGSPEMLMELAYRLAVEDSPFIQNIRKNVIVLLTPVLETDGRDRVLDVIFNRAKYPGLNPIYWGHYVQHDNNRDGMSLALALTRNVMASFLEYHPLVLHDLHESVPFLYTSTGSGPYNAWLDPIVINEWHMLAYQEINEMSKRGVPGVWTHGFYDGWAPNYMFFLANGHNAIGRFYETFGNSDPATQDRTVGAQATRDWFRPNPPLARVKWSLRNNVNYQQSAGLFALQYTADHRMELLNSFYLKSKRAIEKAATEGPAAYIFPSGDVRQSQQLELVHLLQLHGIEVHAAKQEFKADGHSFGIGSFIVRMDQPYSRMADMLMDQQYYNVTDPNPYDDTGWSLGPLKNVQTDRVLDSAVLSANMELLPPDYSPKGAIYVGEMSTGGATGTNSTHLLTSKYVFIHNRGDAGFATCRFLLGDISVNMPTAVGDGTGRDLIVETASLSPEQAKRLYAAILTSRQYAEGRETTVPSVPVRAPRIALFHNWQFTQNEGWWRIGFDQWKVPYDYIDPHKIRDIADLKSKWDVIVFSPGIASGGSLVSGVSAPNPIPWKKTTETPNLGLPDSSDDIRGGIGEAGMQHLKDFVAQGGTLIAATGSCNALIDLGLAKGVTTVQAPNFQGQGTVLNTVVMADNNAIVTGFDKTLAAYFSNSPFFQIEGETGPPAPTPDANAPIRARNQGFTGRPSGRGAGNDPDIIQGRKPLNKFTPDGGVSRFYPGFDQSLILLPEWARELKSKPDGPTVVMRFADAKNLLVSGMLAGGDGLAGRAAVVDVKNGLGHVVLFATNPMWRAETQGSYPLVFNACLYLPNLTVK
ncbi:MAG: M14 family zinc carboxypeptidase [Chthonomonadales bacterium]